MAIGIIIWIRMVETRGQGFTLLTLRWSKRKTVFALARCAAAASGQSIKVSPLLLEDAEMQDARCERLLLCTLQILIIRVTGRGRLRLGSTVLYM